MWPFSTMIRTADSIVRETQQRAEDARWRRWCDSWRALHLYLLNQHGDQTAELAQRLLPERSSEWDEPNGAHYRYYPWVRLVASTLGVAFHRPPELYLHRGDYVPLPDTDPQVRQWRLDEKTIKLQQKLPAVEAMVIVLGQAVVMPAWRRGKLRWDVFAPYEVRALPDPSDPSEWESCLDIQVELRRPTTSQSLGLTREWLSWSRTEEAAGDKHHVHMVDANGSLSSTNLFADGATVNEYGVLPAVLWQFEAPEGGELFVAPDEVMLRFQSALNVKITDIDYGLLYQAHPQAVEFGQPQDAGRPMVGPQSVRRYQDKGTDDFQYRTPPLNIVEARNNAEWGMTTYAVARGFPPDTFSPNSSTRNLAAKQHEALRLETEQLRVRPLVVDALERTFEVHKVVGNYWAQRGGVARVPYDPDVRLGVNLAPLPRVVDAAQGEQVAASHRAVGLSSTLEQEMTTSGSGRVEAQARIDQRRAAEAAASPQSPPA